MPNTQIGVQQQVAKHKRAVISDWHGVERLNGE